jgi:hypothetical protein
MASRSRMDLRHRPHRTLTNHEPSKIQIQNPFWNVIFAMRQRVTRIHAKRTGDDDDDDDESRGGKPRREHPSKRDRSEGRFAAASTDGTTE